MDVRPDVQERPNSMHFLSAEIVDDFELERPIARMGLVFLVKKQSKQLAKDIKYD